jgi:hypothetical protein
MSTSITSLATQIVEAGVETAEAALTAAFPHLPIESLVRLAETIAALISKPDASTLEAATIAADDALEDQLAPK